MTNPQIIKNPNIGSYLRQCFNHWKTCEDTELFRHNKFNDSQQQFMALGLIFERTVIDSSTINIVHNIYIKVIEIIAKRLHDKYSVTIQDLRRSNQHFREFIIRPKSDACSKDFSTVDITMCQGAFQCQYLKEIFLTLPMIKQLQVYNFYTRSTGKH